MATAFNLTPDRVAVFDTNYNQVFQFARPTNARVSERSRLLDHPIETGQIITDYSIVLPIEIQIAFIVGQVFYQQMYQQIRALYLSKQLLTVQTSTSSYQNMVIAEMPHEERPELYDALPINLSFRQVQIVPDPTTYSPADATQDDTEALGQQSSYSISGVQTTEGTETIPGTSYSSVPPATIQATGVQTTSGAQNISIPTNENVPVVGVQTLTPAQSISTAFGGSGVPIGSNQ